MPQVAGTTAEPARKRLRKTVSPRTAPSQAAIHAAAAAELRAVRAIARGVGDAAKVQQQAATAAKHAARGVNAVFGASRAVHLREQLGRHAAAAHPSSSSSAYDASRLGRSLCQKGAPSQGSSVEGAVPPLYFECQQAGYARCGLHALNNALGGEVITADDMSQACTEYLAEMAFEGPPIPNCFIFVILFSDAIVCESDCINKT